MKTIAPEHLTHKPIITTVDYDKVDHPQSSGKGTDAKAISIGISQYDGGGDMSIKLWRYSGKQWSRQSEELPLKRVLDMTILLLASMVKEKKGDFITKYFEVQELRDVKEITDFIKINRLELEDRLREINFLSEIYRND